MFYYEVWIADGAYQANTALTYAHHAKLAVGMVVTVPLRNRSVTGFIARVVSEPSFTAKAIHTVVSETPLPMHSLPLAEWVADYWAANLGDVLKQFGPSQTMKRVNTTANDVVSSQASFADFDGTKLTRLQQDAIHKIRTCTQHTLLLHGVTGAGKTRVYLELAREQINTGKSVLLLTPEIALTTQLAQMSTKFLGVEPVVFHSNLSISTRKKLWLKLLQSDDAEVIIGPRSALFLPVHNLGLVVVDEAHEGAYKQEQVPRYNALRVASKLAALTGAKTILGSATPSVTDYFVANQKQAVVSMNKTARRTEDTMSVDIVDSRRRELFNTHPYISQPLLSALKTCLKEGRQSLLFLNRRGTARLIACEKCGWQLICPHCDIPLTYHGDTHMGMCHSCGYSSSPPTSCPDCGSNNVIYKGIGTKALELAIAKLFPQARIVRFDSDNTAEDRLEKRYDEIASGAIDIIIGTQLVAKGLDLPKLGLVGVIVADSGLWMPDYTADERTFQLLSQVIGRVGRGHGSSTVVVQTYQPESPLIVAAINRDWDTFYEAIITERQTYRFPPFSYLLKLVCRRKTEAGAQKAASQFYAQLIAQTQTHKVEVIGPMPSFREKRGQYYYWQIVCKSKNRQALQAIAQKLPNNWSADLDPSTLL